MLNIAEGNGRFAGVNQAAFYETAYKAAIQSAALVDVAFLNGTADSLRLEHGRELLQRIATMLKALKKYATSTPLTVHP